MTELVIRNYWWPDITKNIEKYVDRYDMIYIKEWRIEQKHSREVNGKWDTREAMNVLNSRFYHKVTISNRKECNFSVLWQ